MAQLRPHPFRCLRTAALAAAMAHAGPAMAGDASMPAPQAEAEASAILSDYTRRIREVVEPDAVRRACNAPSGSYATNDTITVCGEAQRQSPYRVPREVAVAPKAEDLKSPVDKGRALMKSGDGGPVGNTADLGGTGFNPLMFGAYAYKFVEKMIENAQEE